MSEQRRAILFSQGGEQVCVGTVEVDGYIPYYARSGSRIFAFFTQEAQGKSTVAVLHYREIPEPVECKPDGGSTV